MMVANNVDVKENATHQPLLSSDKSSVVVASWLHDPMENLCDQLNHHVEGCNPAPQNLNDLRAALQEEWNAMPQ